MKHVLEENGHFLLATMHITVKGEYSDFRITFNRNAIDIYDLYHSKEEIKLYQNLYFSFL